MVRNMNGRRMTKSVPAAPQRRRRRKRGMALRGGRVALSPKELKLHARLIAEASLKSGRSGAYVYYTDKGKQRYRRYVVPKDPRTPRQHLSRAIFAAARRSSFVRIRTSYSGVSRDSRNSSNWPSLMKLPLHSRLEFRWVKPLAPSVPFS